MHLPFRANRFPALTADAAMDAAIGNDFNVAISQEQVDQYAVICVPYPRLSR